MHIELVPRGCPVCGPNVPARLFSETNAKPEDLDSFAFASRKLPEYMHWRLQLCEVCQLLYADPIPKPEDLFKLYKQADFDSSGEANLAARTYGSFLPEIAARLKDKSGALDVGTGDGVFLRELLKNGFTEVEGIEPSSSPIAAADPAIRPLIRQEMFREGVFKVNSMSLITLFQTIEHLTDPLGVCQEFARVLKPGGAVFMIGHNRKALSAKLLGMKSPIFDIEHMQLFSPTGLKNLLLKAGLEPAWIRPFWNRYPISYWSKLFPLPRGIKTKVLAGLKDSALGRIMLPLPAGNMAALAFKK